MTVSANGSKTLNYTCTYSSAPRPLSGTNTGTATWDKAAFGTPDGSASGQATFTFGTPSSTVNQIIHVTDSFAGALGTCTATDSTPFASCTFNYSRTITVKAGCFFYDNTATITETSQTGSKEVEVCGPAATGALTMGFWQNKNGQAIIGGAIQTYLGNFLRGYHPFSDAPSTGLATYVYNIIKAATCSGPASSPCNKMLRAQMLATALDMYFSDPALGGNKISAPGPIGAVKIDLTHVCNMIDGSGGTATCSGTFLDVKAQFGGAICLMILDMLAYQNVSDPSADAGAIWYGNYKPSQVNAKNAFDAINNKVAFPCP